jgi:NADH-quinone oxidoreductase chain G
MTATDRPNTVTLTIDGQEVTVPAGTLVVEAARMAGIDVPVFCYHPKLSLAGACRMCMCEIQLPAPPGQQPRPPAPMTACTTRAMNGMVVNTMGPAALTAREAVIEFLLINHPLDCPVCDAGGECPLQDNSHAWGPKESRFREEKRLARKGAMLSPLVVLDQERCIVCYRCTRFMAEIPGEAELDFFQRGYRSELRTIDDQPMQSRFQGNIIELCPCGALTSETYRFKARPHDLDHADSVCAHCPVGCNLILDSRTNVIARVRGRQNEAVNEIWLCDKGRFGHHYPSGEERLVQPLIRGEDGALRGASWPEAVGSAAVRLRQIKEQYGAQAIGVIGGRNLTNEDCYALSRFAREVLETPNVDHRIGARVAPANPLAPYGLNAFNSTYTDAEQAGAILLLGTDVYEEMPVFWLRLRKAVKLGARLIVANPRATEADRLAYHRLRYRPGSEMALLQGLLAALVEDAPASSTGEAAAPEAVGPAPAGTLARPRDLSGLRQALGGVTVESAAGACGVTAETLRAAAATLAGARQPLIYAGARLAIRGDAAGIAAALVNLATALGHRQAVNFFTEGANGRGAEYALLVPDEGGLPAGEIIAQAAEGKIKALYLVGENILTTHPDAAQARRALQNAELVIVHELFPTETAREADIVFAATGIPEKDGTLTNAEGRIQRVHAGLRADAAAVRPDWRILSDLAGEMGVPLGYGAPAEITRDLLADLPAYAGLAGGAIPAEGFVAREALPEPEGPAWAPMPAPEAPEQAGAAPEQGLILLTYSELLGDETMVRPTVELWQMVPEPYVEVNRADAARLGLSDGQLVELRTPRGSLQRTVRVSGRCAAGVCFSPDNIGRPRINELLDWGTPWTRVEIVPAPAPAAVPAGVEAGD